MLKDSDLTLRPLVWARRHERILLPGAFIALLAVYYLTPSPALSWVWLALLVALIWRSPRTALALLPLSFPFWFVPKRVTGSAVFPLSEIILVAIALVIAAKGARSFQRIRWRRTALALLARIGPPTALGAVLLLVGMTFGVFVAVRPHEALRAWRWEIIEPLVYLLLAAATLRGPRWARLMLWAFVGSGVIIAALATAQMLGLHLTFTPVGAGQRLINYAPPATGPYRVTAMVYGSANSAGAWLERALPIALAIALFARGLARWERWLAGAVTLALLPALAWTDSRGAWLGAAAGLGLVIFVWVAPLAVRLWEGFAASDTLIYRVWRWPVLVAGVAILMIVVTIAWSHWGRGLTQAFTAGHTDTGAVRLLLWQSALNMIRDHPLLGVGPDQFLYYYDPAYTNHPYLISHVNGHLTVAVFQPDLAHPHNLLLDLWLSAGLLGLVGYLLTLGAQVWRGVRLFRSDAGQPWWRVVAIGIAGALLATVTHGMLDSAYFQPDLALAFWWGAAALAALSSSQRAPLDV